jgi:hypothetical protein
VARRALSRDSLRLGSRRRVPGASARNRPDPGILSTGGADGRARRRPRGAGPRAAGGGSRRERAGPSGRGLDRILARSPVRRGAHPPQAREEVGPRAPLAFEEGGLRDLRRSLRSVPSVGPSDDGGRHRPAGSSFPSVGSGCRGRLGHGLDASWLRRGAQLPEGALLDAAFLPRHTPAPRSRGDDLPVEAAPSELLRCLYLETPFSRRFLSSAFRRPISA